MVEDLSSSQIDLVRSVSLAINHGRGSDQVIPSIQQPNTVTKKPTLSKGRRRMKSARPALNDDLFLEIRLKPVVSSCWEQNTLRHCSRFVCVMSGISETRFSQRSDGNPSNDNFRLHKNMLNSISQ
ncbi:hypothetical protein RRG08_022432 [Elysia crispata]|uniref:Uncharacterized protein n=1 Tax=Elysia crispata TaxID=231223 RepID=A0AAE1D8B1_9GAST|nr:hypothetical protein RRG08_022432 [Elysia crispata]